ncbi:MAG: hypothetical protein DRG78_12510 [Epsilonproteobacteria bacterium]|nr:MAG: hypothetical protein DRG78_12510 [Campylobacterota bacterium]
MTEKIIQLDNFSIDDAISHTGQGKTSPFRGMVRVYKDGLLETKGTKNGWINNMTIISGREFGAQQLFNAIPAGNQSLIGDLRSHKIDSFGIGSGGYIVGTNETLTAQGPELFDSGLYNPVAINSAAIADPQGTPNIVKKIDTAIIDGLPGSIELIQNDSYIDGLGNNGYYTTVKNTCVIDAGEPTFLNAGESVKIDEAVLYMTDATNINPFPFARVTFPPKWIELESQLIIEWYIIF